jgi:hypothetical protein
MDHASLPEQADDTGWRRWLGGACPVCGDCVVEARLRYAAVVVDRADRLAWHHDLYVGYGANDILAYRLTGADEI